MWKYVISIILFSLGLTSCKEHYTTMPVTPCRRTVLVYMEGRNNMSDQAITDIEEMKLGQIPSDCRLIIYRSRKGDINPTLCEVFAGGDSVLKTYADTVLATDPRQLATVVADTHLLAPAKEVGLVFWSHGSGWRQRLSRGFGSENGRMLTISDMALALGGDRGLDYLFFDCCYMGCTEVAYELRNCADYLVASPCEVPWDGMPYDQTLAELFNPDVVDGLKNAIDITVDSYLAKDPYGNECPSTLALIDLTRMNALIDSVGLVIANPLPDGFRPQRFSLSTPYKQMFTDLGQYLEALGCQIPEGVILHERHTSKIWGSTVLNHCSGLTIFMPDPANNIDYTYKGYNTLSWAKYLNLQ